MLDLTTAGRLSAARRGCTSGYGDAVEFTQDVVIEQPIGEVAAKLADPDHLKAWHLDLVSVERVSGTPGEAGAQSVLNYDNKGRKFRLEETIVESDLPQRTVARYEAMGMKHTLTTTLEAIDAESTRISVHNDMALSGAAKLAGPMLAKSLKKQTDKRVGYLKQWLETGTVVPVD